MSLFFRGANYGPQARAQFVLDHPTGKCQSRVQTLGYQTLNISGPQDSLPIFFNLLGKQRDLEGWPGRTLYSLNPMVYQPPLPLLQGFWIFLNIMQGLCHKHVVLSPWWSGTGQCRRVEISCQEHLYLLCQGGVDGPAQAPPCQVGLKSFDLGGFVISGFSHTF